MGKLDESRDEKTRDDYETPGHVLDRVREVFDGPIGLDPCTSPRNHTKATVFAAEGGLGEWPFFAGVIDKAFVNPPYGQGLKPWVRHCIAQADRGFAVVTLTPSRPDTVWYDELAMTAVAIAQVRGRLTFELNGEPARDKHGKPSPAQFPCCLALIDPHGLIGLSRFVRIMSRDRFARLEQVIR